MLEHTHAFGSYTWISWLALVLGLRLMIVLFALGGAGGIDIPEKQHSDLTSRLAVSQYGLHVNACLQTGLSYIGFQGPKL